MQCLSSRSRRALVSALVASLLALAACGGPSTTGGAIKATTSSASPAATTSSTTSSPATGTLVGAFSEGPGGGCLPCYNPLTDGAGFTWFEEYFQPLVLYGLNFQHFHGVLATSWSVSSGGTQYTFHLRPGVKWQDGVPFTSADVKFTVDLVKKPASASWQSSYFGDVQSITTPNPTTVVFHLAKPDAEFLDALTYLVMLPQHALKNITPAALVKSSWWYTDPIGTGPFKWEKYVPGQYVELAANDAYWGGKPKLAHLIDRYFKEPGSAILALKSGAIAFTYISASEVNSLKGDTNLKIISGPSQVFEGITFNLKQRRWQDLRVRQAFMYALNRPQIVKTIMNGAAQVVGCPYNNPAYVPQTYNHYTYDPAKAKSLLKQANWSAIQGKPSTLYTYYTSQEMTNILTAVQQMLGAVGIQVTPRQVQSATFQTVEGKASLTLGGTANGPDPSPIDINFLSTAAPPNGANYYGINIPKLDQLYAQGLATTDLGSRPAIYQQVCSVFNQQLPWAPLWVTTRYGAVSTSVHNFVWTPSPGGGHYVQNAQDWYVAN